jgi:hypothetical protein
MASSFLPAWTPLPDLFGDTQPVGAILGAPGCFDPRARVGEDFVLASQT